MAICLQSGADGIVTTIAVDQTGATTIALGRNAVRRKGNVIVSQRLKLFFDGGCRPNPGSMETAVVVRGQAYIQRDLGHGGSMDAEWLALIHALCLVRDLNLSDVVLLGDSAAVVGQANGTLTCRGANVQHLLDFRALLSGIDRPRIRYVTRSQNLAGIALARLHVR